MHERTDSFGCWLRRRQLLALGALASAAAPARAAWATRSIPAAEPLRQIRAGGPSSLLAVGASGALWALSASGAAATRLADGLDPLTPLASGHGRIAARHADGGLWVWQGGAAQRGPRDALSPQAGLVVLPLAVVGVAGSHRVLRFEPETSQVWAVAARSAEAVLPDARPLQADLDGRGDGGHLVLLAGPTASATRTACSVTASRPHACSGSSATAWSCCASWCCPRLM